MKNKYLLILLLLFETFYNDVYSQQTKFGITVGLNSAICFTDNYGAEFKLFSPNLNREKGFTIGTYARIPIQKNLIFQPTLSFINKNSSNYNATTKNSISGKGIELTMNYLFRPFKKSSFLIGAGPSFSLVNYSEKFDWMDTLLQIDYSQESNRHLLSYGLNFIAKYEFNQRIAIASNCNFDLSKNCKYQYFGVNMQFGL